MPVGKKFSSQGVGTTEGQQLIFAWGRRYCIIVFKFVPLIWAHLKT